MRHDISHDGRFPVEGLPEADVEHALDDMARSDLAWRSGIRQGGFYEAGDDVGRVARSASMRFYDHNPLLSRVLPSMETIESDLASMLGDLLHAPDAAGTATTGGTESNLLAVWGAIRRGEARGVPRDRANIVVAYSAHPSFTKAATYFGVKISRVPTIDFQADPEAMAKAIDPATVLLVGSAPSYPHGVVDPIETLGAIATERGIDLHVDGCVGSLVLPFVEDMGRRVPVFDLRVEGVTSMSADFHKHGYSAKGASMLLHRTRELQEHIRFSFDDWPNGMYSTRTITGTRSGASLASAWAVIRYLGRTGFKRIVARTMDITDRLTEGISRIDDLVIWGHPPMNKFAYGSTELDIDAVADGLETRGWSVGRQGTPAAINMHVGIVHDEAVGSYLADLDEVCHKVRAGEIVSSGTRASYN